MKYTTLPAAVGARLEPGVGRLEPERDNGGVTYRWLVENFSPEGQSTGLYMLCQVNMTVTANPNAARKFRRQHTAEFRALDMREARRGDWRAVEHGFDDSKTPAGCSENGGLGWCDEHKPEVATRCEGCAELRDQLRDLTRQSNLDAMRVGKLAEDAERHSALHARLFVEKTAAQIDAENLREVLHRMLEAPTTQISAGWKDAIRQAMSAAVPDSKPPNVGIEPPYSVGSNDGLGPSLETAMKDTNAIDQERQRRGAELAAELRDAISFPPLPPSPAEVGDLILKTLEHVQALGWGNREQLYTGTQVRAVMYECAIMSAARERERHADALRCALEALDYCIEDSAELLNERTAQWGQYRKDRQEAMAATLERHRAVAERLRAMLSA